MKFRNANIYSSHFFVYKINCAIKHCPVQTELLGRMDWISATDYIKRKKKKTGNRIWCKQHRW